MKIQVVWQAVLYKISVVVVSRKLYIFSEIHVEYISLEHFINYEIEN